MCIRSTPMVLVILSVLFCATGCGECEHDRIAEIEARNRATVQRIHEEINNGNQVVFDEVLAPDYVRHCQAMPPQFQTLEGAEGIVTFKRFINDWLTAVPDNRDSILMMFADGDYVAYITNMTGTQSGALDNLPASGNQFELTNIIIHRFNEDGRIAETWVSWDNIALLSQLGFFPPPNADNP